MDEDTIIATEDDLITRVSKARNAMMKDMFVYTMAMAQLTRPGARTRAVNAARRIDAILKEYKVMPKEVQA